jgi:hypothetical protein
MEETNKVEIEPERELPAVATEPTVAESTDRPLLEVSGSSIASHAPASTALAEYFSVTVNTMSGTCETIEDLHAEMHALELCELVAARFKLPNFAVRLMFNDQVIHMSCVGMTLRKAGIVKGSQLLLVKNFGWSKPDLSLLDDMQKQWRGCEAGGHLGRLKTM